jgi:sugar O-acyltransferase (sialic acid O-acetyltransferase NeuD family)
MKQDLVLIGGGGHCKACIEVIESTGAYSIAGIVDVPARRGEMVCGYPVIASDDDLRTLADTYHNFLITVGHIKSSQLRERLFEAVLSAGGALPSVVASTAYVSPHALVARGTIVMHHAFVNAAATVGEGCIINTASIVEHDVVIGRFCHVSTGAVLNGDSRVGAYSFIGSNSCVREGICIGDRAVIGAGSVVIADVRTALTVVGNPARARGDKHG